MAHFFERTPIAELYRWFAGQTSDSSPIWERLCLWIAEQPEILAKLDVLPGQSRQPNRFLAALRFHDAPLEPGPELQQWLATHWGPLSQTIVGNSTQTNEPGRLRALAPIWARLQQPVALLELGASAGLCLLPDRLGYPDVHVAARLGVDVHPLDVRDEDARRWLRCLVWPGESEREQRLQAALEVAAQDPPEIRFGDLLDDPADLIGALVAELQQRCAGATVVVYHSMVLGYLPRPARGIVVDAIRATGARWVAFEPRKVLTALCDVEVPQAPPWGDTLLMLDGVPQAWCQAHGQKIEWIR
ncbi:MAG: DUF2332 domain-containing protein [Propionibacteriaceae bacterium]|nr:DUF2332 domain-containing protein [Propionibacteriaceae bacterium]